MTTTSFEAKLITCLAESITQVYGKIFTESCSNYNLHFLNDFEMFLNLFMTHLNFRFNIHLNLFILFVISIHGPVLRLNIEA